MNRESDDTSSDFVQVCLCVNIGVSMALYIFTLFLRLENISLNNIFIKLIHALTVGEGIEMVQSYDLEIL